jgi:hypothetical protein
MPIAEKVHLAGSSRSSTSIGTPRLLIEPVGTVNTGEADVLTAPEERI